MLENLMEELKKLERPLKPEVKERLMLDIRLSQEKLNIEDPRFKNPEWEGKSSIYFHSYQDLIFASHSYSQPVDITFNPEEVMQSQACFVQDLENYLKLLPESEDPSKNIRGIFEMILKVGTSAYWNRDRGLVVNLFRVYDAIDNTIIRPWVRDGPKAIILQ